MGQRVLLLSPQILVEVLKVRERSVSFTVENGLPDDANVISFMFSLDQRASGIILESQSWDGIDLENPLPDPVVYVREIETGSDGRGE